MRGKNRETSKGRKEVGKELWKVRRNEESIADETKKGKRKEARKEQKN